MAESYITDGMLEMFLYESEQMLEQLETITLEKEKEETFDTASVNEIFRCMHTIKGSSGVMMYHNIASISHKLEDVFYYIRESHPTDIPHKELVGHIMDVCEFIRTELEKIKNGEEPDGNAESKIQQLDDFLNRIKNHITSIGAQLPPENTYKEPGQYYIAPVASNNSKFFIIYIYYRSDTEMANIHAYTATYALKEIAEDILFEPEDIISNEKSCETILKDGFLIALQTQSKQEEILHLIDGSGIEKIDIHECTPEEFLRKGKKKTETKISGQTEALMDEKKAAISDEMTVSDKKNTISKESKQELTRLSEFLIKDETKRKEIPKPQVKQSFISVNITKMDELMDLIGELVIAEAVVLQNPDLKVPGLDLTNFQKAAGQLSKITSELQDSIMSMRMMPLNNTFQKMNRIVYDVSRKLDKNIDLVIIGENTEVDKNIIEHISDPLMHLIRNAVDHGIESKEVRAAKGKPEKATITLEAKNEGGKVWISVKDDGKGLVREKILTKAKENGLLNGKNEKELSDKEVFNFITLPGFSTKEQVTEYSGRGVGMDVVVSNIQAVGGSLEIDSKEDEGSTMTLKIPLTLAIMDGIILGIGTSSYVVATEDVKEFVCAAKEQIIIEPEGTECILLRGECCKILRLKQYYHMTDGKDKIEEGILAILEHENKRIALLVDELIGEQEIVVKPIPSYIKKVKGLSGCTQLGDGSISLILDVGSLLLES